jgi:hypothetical protein
MDNLTLREQIVFTCIKNSDHDNDGIKFEYESNLVGYTRFTFTEITEILESLLNKNIIIIKYDYWNNKVYQINN